MFTFARVAFRKNGLINMMQVLKIGPILTTWMVHFFNGKLSNLVAPTRQFFGMSHLSIAEVRPVQSAITVMPLICVNGSFSNTCIQMSSINDASQNWVFDATFPRIFRRNRSERKLNWKLLQIQSQFHRRKKTYLIWPQERLVHFYRACRAAFVNLSSVSPHIRIRLFVCALGDYHAKNTITNPKWIHTTNFQRLNNCWWL